MSIETIFLARKNETVTTRVDDEAIVLDMTGEEYFGLEGAALALWENLESGPKSFEEIITHWMETYDNSQEEISELLLDTIAQLERSSLIVVENKTNK